MKRVYAIEKYCMGCTLCEVACKVEHSKSKDIIKAYKQEYPKPASRAAVYTDGPVSLSLQCRHCVGAPCVQACITGAMHVKDDGTVDVNFDKCIACWMCVMACPFGVIRRGAEGIEVSLKCDLCPNRDLPACVEVCPNDALVYEER